MRGYSADVRRPYTDPVSTTGRGQRRFASVRRFARAHTRAAARKTETVRYDQ